MLNWLRMKETLLDVLLPQTCPACRQDINSKEALCRGCRALLRPAEPPWCLRCCAAIRSTRSHCLACSSRIFACGLIRAAFLYRGPAPPLIHAFKYKGRASAAKAAGAWMAEAWPRFPELKGFDAILPMPLHPRRQRERGYNQAELLARELSAGTGLPCAGLISRLKFTRPQWTLSRQKRFNNVKNVFRAEKAAAGGKFLLIDDVCTSGASLEGCAQALLEAGAIEVGAYVFARQSAI